MWKTKIYTNISDAKFVSEFVGSLSLYEMANGDTHTHTLPMTNIDRRTTGTVARRLEWVRPTTWVNLSIFLSGLKNDPYVLYHIVPICTCSHKRIAFYTCVITHKIYLSSC